MPFLKVVAIILIVLIFVYGLLRGVIVRAQSLVGSVRIVLISTGGWMTLKEIQQTLSAQGTECGPLTLDLSLYMLVSSKGATSRVSETTDGEKQKEWCARAESGGPRKQPQQRRLSDAWGGFEPVGA